MKVGSVEWERAGGPALTPWQRFATLTGAGVVTLSHLAQLGPWQLGRRGLLPARIPAEVNLGALAPPETRATRDAEERLQEMSTPEMVHHSFRTYYFSMIVQALGPPSLTIDRETLWVAAMLHDVGLFEANPPATEHCFTVAGARHGREIASASGWAGDRQDRLAMAITTNLNSFVSPEVFGAEAHVMRMGGLVEVAAQEWRVHPTNLAELLSKHPREGFAAETKAHVRRQARLHPGCRFAVLNWAFPLLVRWSRFSGEQPG